MHCVRCQPAARPADRDINLTTSNPLREAPSYLQHFAIIASTATAVAAIAQLTDLNNVSPNYTLNEFYTGMPGAVPLPGKALVTAPISPSAYNSTQDQWAAHTRANLEYYSLPILYPPPNTIQLPASCAEHTSPQSLATLQSGFSGPLSDWKRSVLLRPACSLSSNPSKNSHINIDNNSILNFRWQSLARLDLAHISIATI